MEAVRLEVEEVEVTIEDVEEQEEAAGISRIPPKIASSRPI